MYEGSIRKRDDGRYELQMTIGKDKDGKRIRKSFYGTKKSEVAKKKDEWLREHNINAVTKVDPLEGTMAFSEWADEWLEIYKKPTVKPYTYMNTYKTRVDKYLKPYFKDRPINAITQIDIQKFFNTHTNLSIALLKTLSVILNSIFNKGIDNALCTSNPAKNAVIKSNQKKKQKLAYNAAQQEKAMNWCIENKAYDLLTILKTGIRRGELLGLKWTDVDFKNKIIYINESISPEVEGVIDKDVKNASSERFIPIDDELISYLSEIERVGEYIFPAVSPNAYGNHASRLLKRMSQDCNIPRLTLHELRHTVGTVLREKGVDIYSISKLLGHASIDVTVSTYVHNDIEVLRRAIGI